MDPIKSLLESEAITEQMKSEIQEAWDTKIKENRLSVASELREEFASKYEHDKGVMVEAIDSMISEKLSEEMTEFHEDKLQLSEAKARYARAMRENSNLLKKFVSKTLVKEISDLHEDQKGMANKFTILEEFIVDQLANEIAEFQEDKKDLAETKVRLVREAKVHFNKVKKTFVERSAKAVERTVNNGLTSEISQLKEDIEVARKNDFGRKIFEAFSSEYLNSHLSESSETKKLLKVLEAKNKQLDTAKILAVKAKTIAESKDAEVKRLLESKERIAIMNELTTPLSRKQRSIMNDLLESVQTSRLRRQFDKYLPSVIDGHSPAKQKAQITEAKEITGNRNNSSIKPVADHNVVDIKRLAGL